MKNVGAIKISLWQLMLLRADMICHGFHTRQNLSKSEVRMELISKKN
jgi:hypothetical protein